MSRPPIDRSRAKLMKTGFQFVPFRPTVTTPLAAVPLEPDEELIVFSRGGESRALLMKEMAYHHVAQGELAGEPYLVSF